MLVSAICHHESATGIHISPPSWVSFPPPSPSHPSRLSLSPGLGALSHSANSHSILDMLVYMFPCYSAFIPLASSNPCPHVHKSVLYNNQFLILSNIHSMFIFSWLSHNFWILDPFKSGSNQCSQVHLIYCNSSLFLICNGSSLIFQRHLDVDKFPKHMYTAPSPTWICWNTLVSTDLSYNKGYLCPWVWP